MLKSEAETMVRRAIENTGGQFTEEQIHALAQMVMKIAGRIVEEAFASYKPGVPGSRPSFFTE